MAKHIFLVISTLVSFQTSNSIPNSRKGVRPFPFFSNNQIPFPSLTEYDGSFHEVPSSRSSSSSMSDDIVTQTRSEANDLKKTLSDLSKKPEAATILEKVFASSDNNCIASMDDALNAIETSTVIFEKAGTEIKQLIQTIKIFQNITEVPQAVRASAAIIRQLDTIIPKLTPTASLCKRSSDDVFESLNSLSDFVNDLASKKDLYYTAQVRQNLISSSQILSKVTNFLTKESHFKFHHFCTKEKEFNIQFINAIEKMMVDLSDLYVDLGGLTVAHELNLHAEFVKKVVANLSKLGDIGDLGLIRLECNDSDSISLVADTLEDLAGIIEDIGMETLCSQLGLESSVCTFYL